MDSLSDRRHCVGDCVGSCVGCSWSLRGLGLTILACPLRERQEQCSLALATTQSDHRLGLHRVVAFSSMSDIK